MYTVRMLFQAIAINMPVRQREQCFLPTCVLDTEASFTLSEYYFVFQHLVRQGLVAQCTLAVHKPKLK